MTRLENRLLFHEELVNILGTEHVYFQPPETIHMVYPAIVYSLDTISNRFADNLHYKENYRYQVMYIDEDPDSEIVERLANYPMSSFNRHYVSDNLNHYVFSIFYR